MKDNFIKGNSDGSKWINITKALIFFMPYSKIRFWNPKLGIKKWFGLRLMTNCKFRIYKGYEHLNWFIRLPFLFTERTNGGWSFGLNKCYLWWHIARK
jgi:hypothetical protein